MSAESYLDALKVVGIIEVTGIDAGYYQGDYFAAVMESEYDTSSYYATDKIGLLVIGYGSCSGCDEWEGSYTAKERLQTLERLVDSIKWHDNLDSFKAYLSSGDPKLEWYGHEEEWATFIAKANALGDYNTIEATP